MNIAIYYRVTLLLLITLTGRAESAAYVVDATNGNDANHGSVSAPFQTITKASQTVKPGDLVNIKPGTYPQDILFPGAGTAAQPIVFSAETPGTVIITGKVEPQKWPGDHGCDAKMYAANGYVTWKGLVFRNTTAFMQLRASQGWRLENSVFELGQNGINVRGRDVVIQGNTFQDLGRHAIVGCGADNLIVRNNTIRRVHSSGQFTIPESAVTKILRTNGLLVENNQSYDNKGPGFWLDFSNVNFTIRGNRFYNNQGVKFRWEGPGLWIELNPGPGIIEDNQFRGNTGAQLGVLESKNLTVRRNLFSGGTSCVEFRYLKRGTVMENISIAPGNDCREWSVGGMVTSIGEWAGWSAQAYNVRIEGTRYTRPGDLPLFKWLNTTTYTAAESCSKLGFECPVNGAR
jgi:parallel beta-helix repeat protein